MNLRDPLLRSVAIQITILVIVGWVTSLLPPPWSTLTRWAIMIGLIYWVYRQSKGQRGQHSRTRYGW